MKENKMLLICSLLSLLLLTLHLTDDVVRGMFPAGIAGLYAAVTSGVLLYAMLVLGERRSGQVIMLIVSLVAVTMPILHMRGVGVAESAKSSGGFFFVWTLIALGTTGTFSFILSVRGLLSPQAGQAQS